MLFAANVHEFILLPRISSLGQGKQFYESKYIPIWDATINRICVNDKSNTKHLHLHAMLVAAYVHEFILLSRISSLEKHVNVVSKEIWKAFLFFRSSNFQKISVDQKARHGLHVFGEKFPPEG